MELGQDIAKELIVPIATSILTWLWHRLRRVARDVNAFFTKMRNLEGRVAKLEATMPVSDYSKALAFTFDAEQGFVDDPADRGGTTNMGVTAETLTAYRGRAVTAEDVRALTPEEATKIYFELWWAPLCCDKLWSLPIKMALFDASVPFGRAQATRSAQRALRSAGFVDVDVDGVVGVKTISRLNAVPAATFLNFFVTDLNTVIGEIIERHPTDAKFEHGWRARVAKYLTLCA